MTAKSRIRHTYLSLSLPEPDFELLYLERHKFAFHDKRGRHGILVGLLSLLKLLPDEIQLHLLHFDDLNLRGAPFSIFTVHQVPHEACKHVCGGSKLDPKIRLRSRWWANSYPVNIGASDTLAVYTGHAGRSEGQWRSVCLHITKYPHALTGVDSWSNSQHERVTLKTGAR